MQVLRAATGRGFRPHLVHTMGMRWHPGSAVAAILVLVERIWLTRALGPGLTSVGRSPDRGRATQLTSIVSLASSSRYQGASLTLAHQTPGWGLCIATRNCKR